MSFTSLSLFWTISFILLSSTSISFFLVEISTPSARFFVMCFSIARLPCLTASISVLSPSSVLLYSSLFSSSWARAIWLFVSSFSFSLARVSTPSSAVLSSIFLSSCWCLSSVTVLSSVSMSGSSSTSAEG